MDRQLSVRSRVHILKRLYPIFAHGPYAALIEPDKMHKMWIEVTLAVLKPAPFEQQAKAIKP